MADDKLNLTLVNEYFSASFVDHDNVEDVNIEHYIQGYRELNKFFTSMGTMFGFVSQDLESKIEILNDFTKDKEISSNFNTVKSMMDYEISNELLYKKGYVSGSRTLLRLHRGLDFIHAFLKGIDDLKEEDNTSSCCRTAYDKTLSKHHSFVIRNAAKVAMFALPTKKNLLLKVIGDDEEALQKTIEAYPTTLETLQKVFNRIEMLYNTNQLQNLP